jgi:hypothetical protein
VLGRTGDVRDSKSLGSCSRQLDVGQGTRSLVENANLVSHFLTDLGRVVHIDDLERDDGGMKQVRQLVDEESQPLVVANELGDAVRHGLVLGFASTSVGEVSKAVRHLKSLMHEVQGAQSVQTTTTIRPAR